MNNKKQSLDYLAAITSQQIVGVIGKSYGKSGNTVEAKDAENLITKSLGILQSQGIYALYLFLLSRSGDKTKDTDMNAEQRIACEIVFQLLGMLGQEPIKELVNTRLSLLWNQVNAEKREILKKIAESLDKLDQLLLLRDLYEQTLIYARFGAKAEGK